MTKKKASKLLGVSIAPDAPIVSLTDEQADKIIYALTNTPAAPPVEEAGY